MHIQDFKVILTFDDGSYKISDGNAEITLTAHGGPEERGRVGGANAAGWELICNDLRDRSGNFREVWYRHSMHTTSEYFEHFDHPHFTAQLATAPAYTG